MILFVASEMGSKRAELSPRLDTCDVEKTALSDDSDGERLESDCQTQRIRADGSSENKSGTEYRLEFLTSSPCAEELSPMRRRDLYNDCCVRERVSQLGQNQKRGNRKRTQTITDGKKLT